MELVREIMYAIIIACVPILTKYIIEYLRISVDKVNANISETRYDVMSQYILEAERMIENIVTSINQVYVDKLKESGSFTRESQQEAFNTAFETAKKLLSEDAIISIETIYGDLDNYLRTMIESYVSKNKR